MNLNEIIFWNFLTLKGYPVKQAEKTLKAILHHHKKGNVKRWLDSQKWNIFKFHYKKNQYYRKLINEDVSKWEEIPILGKQNFQEPIEKLLSEEYTLKNTYIGSTSGSSGHPFIFAKDKFAHAMSWVVIKYFYNLHGINVFDKQARFYGIPLEFRGFIKEKIKDFLMNRVRFPVFDLSEDVLENWLNRFKKKNFKYIYGYTSSLVYFARYCLQKNVILKKLSPSLKLCIVTSEVLTPEDRSILEKAFGVPVVNEYGASEVGIIAFEYPNKHWVLNNIDLYIEVVDENGKQVPLGEEGRILITSLFNKAMPIIRYEIGDIGILKRCGGKLCLDKLVGRTNDFIKLPSGRISPGLTFYYISRSILEKKGFIKEFIVKQVSIDTFEFDIVSDHEISKKESMELQKCLDTYLEPGLNLIIKRVEKIERSGSGKIKHFYSLL